VGGAADRPKLSSDSAAKGERRAETEEEKVGRGGWWGNVPGLPTSSEGGSAGPGPSF